MGAELYDVAVVGAGPAGSTAAIILAQKGHRVVLVDRNTFPRPATSLGWMNARVAPLLADLGVKAKPLVSRRLKDVRFVSADFAKCAKPHFEDVPGYLVDRVEFGNLLVSAATGNGVEFVQGCAAENIVLKESSVIVELAGGRSVESRLLLLAAGPKASLTQRAGLPSYRMATPMWTAKVEADVKAAAGGGEPRIVVVLGLDSAGSFGQICASKQRVSVVVNWLQERDKTIAALAHLCRVAFSAGAVPMDLSREAVSADVVASPAAAAIDMDSHVGKHTLLIGDAGGFVAALSNEGIYPAMWSARIAADVAVAALGSVHSQDALMSFDSEWRIQMADYMRAPNTDNQFLIPLVFTNQPLADRMGAAFFSGANI